MSKYDSEEFRATLSGWTLTSDVEDIGEYIEASARWLKERNLTSEDLTPEDHKLIQYVIDVQIARGIERGDFSFL